MFSNVVSLPNSRIAQKVLGLGQVGFALNWMDVKQKKKYHRGEEKGKGEKCFVQ